MLTVAVAMQLGGYDIKSLSKIDIRRCVCLYYFVWTLTIHTT